jgi:hypothetical protein
MWSRCFTWRNKRHTHKAVYLQFLLVSSIPGSNYFDFAMAKEFIGISAALGLPSRACRICFGEVFCKFEPKWMAMMLMMLSTWDLFCVVECSLLRFVLSYNKWLCSDFCVIFNKCQFDLIILKFYTLIVNIRCSIESKIGLRT